MIERMKKRMKIWMIKMIPRVYNLPQIIYVKWMGYEWFIKK